MGTHTLIANQTTPPSDPHVANQTEPSEQVDIKEEPPRGQYTNTLSGCNRSGRDVQTEAMGVQMDSCNKSATAVQTAVSSPATALTESVSASVQTDFNSRKDFDTQAELPSVHQIANHTTLPSDPQIGIQTEPSVQFGTKEGMNTVTGSNQSDTAIHTDGRALFFPESNWP